MIKKEKLFALGNVVKIMEDGVYPIYALVVNQYLVNHVKDVNSNGIFLQELDNDVPRHWNACDFENLKYKNMEIIGVSLNSAELREIIQAIYTEIEKEKPDVINRKLIRLNQELEDYVDNNIGYIKNKVA